MGLELSGSRVTGAGAHGTPALAIRNLSKTFGGEHALDGVDLTVLPGEVHGLLGQNGSGKSTLIKVLAGFHDPEPGGVLELFGRPVALPLVPGAFRDLGLAFVHQHLGMVPSLSVLENLRIGAFATEPIWHIDWHAERRCCLETFEKFGLDIDPDAKIGALPQVTRALVAIVRAVEDIRLSQSKHGGDGILILDEPTPFLPRAGIDQLFDLVREVVKDSASVIFVSHDVDEIMDITDRATVLRDGHVVGTLDTARSSSDDFVEMIIGRKATPFHIHHEPMSSRPVEISIKGLTSGSLSCVNIDLHRGEIVGLAGLIGSGFNDVPYLIYGAIEAANGHLDLGGAGFDLADMTPRGAQDAGLALLPADRLGAAGVGSLPVVDNMTLPVLSRFMQSWGLDRRAMMARAGELGTEHEIRPNRPDFSLDALSGGNQQKVLLAKWLQTDPRLLLLDEPTQGVDVGARQQVYMAIDAASARGAAVLCASTDYGQLEQICDRVLIFSRGAVLHELSGAAVTKEQIAEACYKSLVL